MWAAAAASAMGVALSAASRAPPPKEPANGAVEGRLDAVEGRAGEAAAGGEGGEAGCAGAGLSFSWWARTSYCAYTIPLFW